jgi:hypothetical protein
MNLSVTNSNLSSARAQSSKLDSKASEQANDLADLDISSSDSRRLGEDLANQKIKNTVKYQVLPKEEKAIEVLNSVANTGRKLGSKVLNFFGFTGATLTGVSFMFGFKILSALLAVPTVGALYLANHLKHLAKRKEDDLGLLTDPLKIIKKAKSDSLFLESDFNKVLAAMVKIGEFKNTDPRKTEALADLSAVARKVSTKKLELSSTDKTNHELLDLNKFLDIYGSLNPSQSNSETGF